MTQEIERWTGYGASLAGALGGTAVGAAATGDPSGAIAGAAFGSLLEMSLAEAGHRFTSRRQKARIGAVVSLARELLLGHISDGEVLRDDDFMRSRIDGKSSADEVIEHVIQTAQQTYEERKLPHIAAVLANTAVSTDINEVTAHFVLSTVDRLSWPKLVAIALVGDKEDHPLPDLDIGRFRNDWTSWSAHKVFDSLYYEDHLLGRSGESKKVGSVFAHRLSDNTLTPASSLLHSLANLNQISAEERADLLSMLTVNDSPADDDGGVRPPPATV